MVRRRLAGAATLVVATVVASDVARGHVRYVTEGSGESIPPLAFLIEVLSHPLNLILVIGGAVAVVVGLAGYLQYAVGLRDVAVFREALREYGDLVPWILRLSIGLPLVGAGFAGYYFSPVVAAPTRVFQVALGFFILFGLMTRLVAAVGLVAYLVGLAFEPALLLASEYVPGFLGIVLLGSGRPSADQLLHRVAAADGTVYNEIDPVHRVAEWFNALVDPYERYVATILRVGVGFNFAYLGLVEKLLEPGRALQVVEKYDLTAVVPVDPGMWVLGAGLTELAVGLALVAGFFTRAFAIVAFVMFTLTLFGLPDDPVLAHVTLFGLGSAIVVLGGGPLSLDERLRTLQRRDERTRAAAPGND